MISVGWQAAMIGVLSAATLAAGLAGFARGREGQGIRVLRAASRGGVWTLVRTWSRKASRWLAVSRPGARRREYEEWRESLEEGLWALARALQAGHNLHQAIEVVRRESEGPFQRFLADVLAVHKSGVPLAQSLRQVAGDFRWTESFYLAEVLELGTRSGGHLLENIRALQEIVRDRAVLKAQLAAGTGEARLSAWVLGLTPLVLLVFMVVFQRDMLAPLVHDPIGRVGAAYAVISWTSGVLVIRGLLRLPEGEEGL